MRSSLSDIPYIIGVTGGIGSGKSVVSRLLRLMGIPVYDCDREAKRLMLENADVRRALVSAAGERVYTADGQLDRAYLASYMFGNAEHVALVNAIVHPAVRDDFRQWAQRIGREIVAVESALLFEAGMEADVDTVVYVYAPEAVRLARAIQRDASNESSVRRRMQSQLSEQEYMQRADNVICNDGSHSLINQTLCLLRSFTH